MVDFPAPLGPRKPTISPFLIVKEMLLRDFDYHKI
jgi:hypothetical protein